MTLLKGGRAYNLNSLNILTFFSSFAKILLGQIPEGASVHITKEGNELQLSAF
ncbi:hypothetical protein BARBAKC583_0223 [Bartonella bacilliformis KC583]|uniref:Uncharacterized protein n=1 Tax=Bartonella bacilliformis (strain ATCC 35685 / KC583 / Herrer 020/F12,63) TaxID=360095 RepID=A1URF3_BARBK|nr:hypothetical protein BARBAKC583_0223 [Bartonella bacilliformis KC583]